MGPPPRNLVSLPRTHKGSITQAFQQVASCPPLGRASSAQTHHWQTVCQLESLFRGFITCCCEQRVVPNSVGV